MKGNVLRGPLQGKGTSTAQRRSPLRSQFPKRSPLRSGGGRSRAAFPKSHEVKPPWRHAPCRRSGRPRHAKRCTPRAAAANACRAVRRRLSRDSNQLVAAGTPRGMHCLSRSHWFTLGAVGADTPVVRTATTPTKLAGFRIDPALRQLTRVTPLKLCPAGALCEPNSPPQVPEAAHAAGGLYITPLCKGARRGPRRGPGRVPEVTAALGHGG